MGTPTATPDSPATSGGRAWLWMALIAGVLIVLGLVAMGSLSLGATVFVVVLGWLLVGAGVLQIGGALLFRGGGLLAELGFGALSIAMGALLIQAPVMVGSLIALLIVGGLIVSAVLSGVRAALERRFAWWLPVLIAVLSLGLGFAVIARPTLLLPLLGLLVGANLLLRGVILLLSAIELRSLSR